MCDYGKWKMWLSVCQKNRKSVRKVSTLLNMNKFKESHTQKKMHPTSHSGPNKIPNWWDLRTIHWRLDVKGEIRHSTLTKKKSTVLCYNKHWLVRWYWTLSAIFLETTRGHHSFKTTENPMVMLETGTSLKFSFLKFIFLWNEQLLYHTNKIFSPHGAFEMCQRF